jgi:hypothetical protein
MAHTACMSRMEIIGLAWQADPYVYQRSRGSIANKSVLGNHGKEH